MQGFIQDFLLGEGEGRHRQVGDFGGVSHINHGFRDYRVRADKLSRIHTGFCVGRGEGITNRRTSYEVITCSINLYCKCFQAHKIVKYLYKFYGWVSYRI